MSYRTPFTVLEASASRHPSVSVFKIPKAIEPGTGRVYQWTSISYSQFKEDLERYAKYWRRTLLADGVQPRSVVALWYVLDSATYKASQ